MSPVVSMAADAAVAVLPSKVEEVATRCFLLLGGFDALCFGRPLLVRDALPPVAVLFASLYTLLLLLEEEEEEEELMLNSESLLSALALRLFLGEVSPTAVDRDDSIDIYLYSLHDVLLL